MVLTRRRVVASGTGMLAAVGALPTPSIAQNIKELKLVTSWTQKGMSGLQASTERLAHSITALSDGHLKVTLYPADNLIGPFEVFDAVSSGTIDMYHTDEVYFVSKSPALNFFAAVPYGFTADELSSWITFGGGQALWDEVDAQFNIKPLMATNTGVQMGGWFNKEMNAPGDYKGLRYRMPELGAEVLRRMGATVVTTPGGEIPTALKSGAIDAAEWIGPWIDMDLGLDKSARLLLLSGLSRARHERSRSASPKRCGTSLTASGTRRHRSRSSGRGHPLARPVQFRKRPLAQASARRQTHQDPCASTTS